MFVEGLKTVRYVRDPSHASVYLYVCLCISKYVCMTLLPAGKTSRTTYHNNATPRHATPHIIFTPELHHNTLHQTKLHTTPRYYNTHTHTHTQPSNILINANYLSVFKSLSRDFTSKQANKQTNRYLTIYVLIIQQENVTC